MRRRTALLEHFGYVFVETPLFAGTPPQNGAAEPGSMYRDEFEKTHPTEWQVFPWKAHTDWTFTPNADGSIVGKDMNGSVLYDPKTRKWGKVEDPDDSFTF